MQATVLSITAKGNHAFISVKETFECGIINEVTGLVGIVPGKVEVNQVITLNVSKVIQRKSTTEDGAEFTHLSFE